jgi:transposase
LQVSLVDPRPAQQVSGRPQTDVLDCQWIQRPHSYGLLAASFRPEGPVVGLRSYLRQRQMLIRYAGQHAQHRQKALEQMHVPPAEVVSDSTGVTGRAILRALRAGRRDPSELAPRRHARCPRTEAEIARALYGNWREEHLFALRQALELYETYQAKPSACAGCSARRLPTCADQSGGQALGHRPRRRRRRRHEPAFAARTALVRFSGGDRALIAGIGRTTALTILGEVGRALSKWPTAKHFVSGLGLCPQHQGSAGKIRSRHPRRGANPAARALRRAAPGCHHARNALGAFSRRLPARCGGPKAGVAAARKIAERVYRLLKYGAAYVRQERAAAEEAYRVRLLKGLARQATELGYQLVPATP